MARDRTGVSNRAAAMTSSTVLEDFGIFFKTNPTMTINKMKIRRSENRVKYYYKIKKISPLLVIFLDGRKDKTLLYKKHKENEHFQRLTIIRRTYKYISRVQCSPIFLAQFKLFITRYT